MHLTDKRVLLVEDEAIIAMSVEDMLVDLGCIVIGPALSPGHASRLALEEQIDAAVLDINMGEGASFPVAWILRERGIPFCFATGYGEAGVPEDLSDVPVLAKPFNQESLAGVLRRLTSAAE